MTKISVLIVEDHPVVRLGIRTVIDAQDDLQVSAEIATAREVLPEVRRRRPDAVVLPLRLHGHYAGIELCRDLKAADDVGNTPVMIYTSHNTAGDTAAAYLCGADSFVFKGEPASRFVASVRATARGSRVWVVGSSPEASASWLDAATRRGDLTPREREVLGLILQRFSNAEIGRELFIEVSTVKTHVRSILRKLGLTTRRDLHSMPT